MPTQQFPAPAQVIPSESLLREVDVGHVLIEARGGTLAFSALAQTDFTFLS